ncbi:MAG: large extracellular alpha-helical protein, partial [Thiotrichaceae bacterium]|nr:large extracellular alpha-helical protein [Thiotrichaceae bacterium]
MPKIYLMILAILCGLIQPTWAATSFKNSLKTLQILRVTPSGNDVQNLRQIVFTFNQPVVPLGKMERDNIPVTIKPAVKCKWRWINPSNLACKINYKDKLQIATRYNILMLPGIETESKKRLKAPYHHSFVTKRPKIRSSYFETWRAPGLPKIKVYFNQTVSSESVAKHLYFQTNRKKRIPIRVEHSSNTSWIVSPRQLLPLDTKVRLKVEQGIQAQNGSELGIEERTVVSFHTFPKFQFLGVECTMLNGTWVLMDTLNKDLRCDPQQNISLQFSSPVIKEVVKENLVISPTLSDGRSDPWDNVSSSSELGRSHKKYQSYRLTLPSAFKPYHAYQLKSEAITFKDEFGRSLPEPIDLSFLTDHLAPNHYFTHEISVLEKGIDSEVPIIISNLDEITFNYRLLTPQGWSAQKQKSIAMPQVEDVTFRHPLGIRDLISKPSGFVQGYFTTTPDVNNVDASDYNWFRSQITPYHIQTKLGHHNTLVWVTDFATGLPVSDVDVSIYLNNFENTSKPLAIAITDINGIALLPGTKTLDPELKHASAYYAKEHRFFIRCQKDQDIALLPLDYFYRLSMSVYPYRREKYGHIHTWGTTAQGVYKVGDTVQYKVFVRDQSNKKFIAAPTEGYTLTVIDPMGNVAHEVKDFNLSEFGAFDGEFNLVKTAAVGWYNFELSSKYGRWYPFRVLVSDFTPSPFRVTTDLEGKVFHLGETVKVNTSATLHAGGPYVNA